MRKITTIGIVVCTLMLLYSCSKSKLTAAGDAFVFVNADTLKYDTVFTTTGSITQSFKIINENEQKIVLTSIRLMGGAASAFKINVNGMLGPQVENAEIAADDSIYVFVTVTINPSSASLPFVVRDSIFIDCNGVSKYVQLEAYGQNAHFLRNQKIRSDVTWANDLPYVIIGDLSIDTSASLTIEAGCKLFFHANATMLVDGSLVVNGSKNNEVIFTGDRLDRYYKDLPGSWPGIAFRKASKNNVISYAVIKNANRAIDIRDPSMNTNPKLTIHQSIIDNAFESGVFSSNSSLNADNTLFSNCGNNIKIEGGGNYKLINCTNTAYSSMYIIHNNPVLQLNNFSYDNGILLSADLKANFTNCLFWGDGGLLSDEILIQKEGTNIFDVVFDHCLYKNSDHPANSTVVSSIINEDPEFDSIDVVNQYFDFRTTKNVTSPVIDNGINTTFSKDLDDKSRWNGIATDIGCYEKQ